MALFFECMQSCAQKVLDTGRHCQRRDFATVRSFSVAKAFVEKATPSTRAKWRSSPELACCSVLEENDFADIVRDAICRQFDARWL